jgi:hypothetical protein
MSRPLSLDRKLGASNVSRLYFLADETAPDPTRGIDSFDSLTDLVAQLPPGDAPAVIDFVDTGKPLPIAVLNRLRDRFTPAQVAALIGLDRPKEKNMTNDPPDRPTEPPLWRIADSVWAEASALLERLDPPRGSAPRTDRRVILNAAVNRAISGASYKRLAHHFGNAITCAQTADKWFVRGAYRPLVLLLVERCPELDTADWARVLSKPLGEKYAAGKYGDGPTPPRKKRPVGRPEPVAEPVDLATRLGVSVQPTPLGQVTLGGLSFALLLDPRPAAATTGVRHVYGGEAAVVFPIDFSIADVGRAVAAHLQRSLDAGGRAAGGTAGV